MTRIYYKKKTIYPANLTKKSGLQKLKRIKKKKHNPVSQSGMSLVHYGIICENKVYISLKSGMELKRNYSDWLIPHHFFSVIVFRYYFSVSLFLSSSRYILKLGLEKLFFKSNALPLSLFAIKNNWLSLLIIDSKK